ncbi:hypothetical protein BCT30_11195 [Enterovibrio norvegicus]|nr:hypothetical protein A1OS_05400 [Enterovibrio norvegicus]OEF54820.1 hypothetical protein A1OU_20665 [Enterovibrio norvegicus]PMH71106.1 hypothetical protein BCU62_05610 [Enterovibrio norvegicus]PMI34027.1 hypothetical protein BCU47_01265 [Enterovibrio norvegicus]PMI36069.1 hypothetical protein BCU46_16120 [Enterovibrio norvegicus]
MIHDGLLLRFKEALENVTAGKSEKYRIFKAAIIPAARFYGAEITVQVFACPHAKRQNNS